MRERLSRIVAARAVGVFGVVLASLALSALAHEPTAELATAVTRFIASLSDEQQQQAVFDFAAPHRTRWFFVPDKFIQDEPAGKRLGLTIKSMSPQQRHLAQGILMAVLEHRGQQQALAIMSLEQVLHDLENANPIRDPELYYISIYGNPAGSLNAKPPAESDKPHDHADRPTWSVRWEGHHLSLNVTVAAGERVSLTPSFFGSNPGEVREGPFKGLQILAAEQSLARELVQSLDTDQLKLALLDGKAPDDIITSADRAVNKGVFLPAQGVPFEKLRPTQQRLLLALVESYAGKYRPELLEQIDDRKKIADGHGLFFAWAGGTEPGQGHYYRIQSEHYLFEYDNTQNNANHVHAVWRDLDGDFGADILAEHYRQAHGK